MTFGHQHGHRRLSRPWISTEPSVVAGVKDINPDSGQYGALVQDMALGHSSGLDDIIALR